jgi:hypothetical protein
MISYLSLSHWVSCIISFELLFEQVEVDYENQHEIILSPLFYINIGCFRLDKRFSGVRLKIN